MANNEFAGNDIIDVRDIISRVEALREERDSLAEDIKASAETEDDGTQAPYVEYAAAQEAFQNWKNENAEELAALESLLSDLCGNGGDEQWDGDWYPVTLIHENYFETSMDEMVADCYELPKDIPSFMTLTIDYDALKQDYSEVEFEGDTYYYR